MSQQTIGIGTTANDGTGDDLRTSFGKVNDNFTEIYTELGGTSLSNLTITGNTISSDNTNGDINFDPNGTGDVVITSGNITVTSGTVTATTFIGALTGNVTGNVSGTAATVTGASQTAITTLGTITGATSITSTIFSGPLTGNASTATTAGTVTTASQPSITSVGTLTSLTSSGDINGKELGLNGNSLVSLNTNSDIIIDPAGTGTIDLAVPTQATIGANGGATALTANPVGYINVNIGGIPYIIPYYNP